MLRLEGDSSPRNSTSKAFLRQRQKFRSNGSILRRMLSAKRVFVLSLSLLLLVRFVEFVASTPVDFVKEEQLGGAVGPIIVGQASYRPPYRQQYGLAIGEVLLDFHDLGFKAGNIQDNEPSIDLVIWCIELGHAHMDDAELGVFFEDNSSTNRESHPKRYHIELALQAYDWASKTLFQMTTEKEFIDMDPVFESNKDKMVHLHYYAIAEYSKGEAFTISAEEAMMSSTSSREFYSSALDAYSKAQTSYEKLRYIYAKLSKAALTEKSEDDDDEYDEDYFDEYFNEERYYRIENYYAHSCFQLGMSLYSKLILDQNDKINKTNEKIMQLSKLGMEDEELDIVTALMDQANGGMGGGRNGGNNAAFSSESMRELTDMLEGNWMEGGLGGGEDSNEWKIALEAIAGYLDTAILTYHQHANPSKNDYDDGKEKPMKVFVNGVPRKSIRELEKDERLFPWQSSLAMAYEKAATVATMLNQHIRSRELMNNALELYSDAILPYYHEQESRERRLKRKDINTDSHESSSPSSMSAMSREYAEVSIGRLYVTLADTTVKLGSYDDSKEAYSKAMDWYTKRNLSPEPDGIFNSLLGDEVALHQYEDFANTFRQELDQYFKNVKSGYVYKDDSYEAGMLLSIAPLYMAMGKAEPAIRFYKDAIIAYERVATVDKSNRMTILDMADARLGLSSAYFHDMRYADSKEQHSIYCQIYQEIYGEGNPPQAGDRALLEEMQDEIIETYGKDYYEQLKAYYGDSSDTGKGTGVGKEGSNAPKIATNFNAFVHDNETMWDDEDDYESDDEKETWSNEEL